MKLRVHEIQDAGKMDVVGTILPEEIPLDGVLDHPVLVMPVKTDVHAHATDKEILAWGKAQTRVRLSCSRCVEDFETPLLADFEMSVSLTETFVDVSEELRQALVLSLPVKPLCQSECRGLCPRCGKNLNVSSCQCLKEVGPRGPFSILKDIQNG
jgi:uncharacterized protein